MTLTQILQKIRSVFYTKSESDTLLSNKANVSDIPSKTSDLTNDSGFITDISGKQDALTTEQLAACNSGITTAKVSTYDGYATSKANDSSVVHTSGNETIAGDKTFTNTLFCVGNINKSSSSSGLIIRGGGADDAGARLGLYGKDHSNKGNFYIYSNDGSASKILRGSANEDSLTWGGKSVDCIDSQGDGWIRYTNGVQICWGTFKNSNGATGTVVSYGAAFASEPTVICSQNIASVYCYSKSVSGTATTKRTFYTTDVNSYVCWQAIGKWK